MNISSILRRREDIVFRKIEEEYVLVPMAGSSEDIECIFNLNETGSVIWEKIDGKKSLQDILDEVCSEYQGDQNIIKSEAIEFISELKKARLIEVV